jgi:glycosyltransferase involved in cell wall biosynthesis
MEMVDADPLSHLPYQYEVGEMPFERIMPGKNMLISFVTPAYNASQVISRALDSIFRATLPNDWQVESIVVDDGSSDTADLRKCICNYPEVRCFSLPENRGKLAAVNCAIHHSLGDYIICLDADDEVVENWPVIFSEILKELPEQCNVIFPACRNVTGRVTASEPNYSGFLSLDDLLNERHSGEYMPVFRGNYARKFPYLDMKMPKPFEIISYIDHAQKGAFWISNRVLRIYHDETLGSITSGWASAEKAADTVIGYEKLFELYGNLYRERAFKIYLTKHLRLAVYRKWASKPGIWAAYCEGLSFRSFRESIGAFFMLILPNTLSSQLAILLKRMNIIRRYG